MTQAIGTNSPALHSSLSVQRSLRSVWTLRLALGMVVLLGAVICFLGTSWDIQWHTFIGRDRTLIPPHLMILGGIGLDGVAALIGVIIETLWARQRADFAKYSTDFAGLFNASLGAYIVGFGALDAAAAFPLDAYWHSLYGIDVTIWAPFHVMSITGMGLMAFGATYMFISAAHLASADGAHGMKCTAYLGVIIAASTLVSIFTFLLYNALDPEGMLNLGFATINVFPFLQGLLLSIVLVAVVTAVPWRWVATSVVGIYLLLAALVQLLIPPAVDLLMSWEHLTFRQSHQSPHIAIVTFEDPLLPILGAILIDLCVMLALRRQWSNRRLMITLACAALLGTIPVVLVDPTYMVNTLAPQLGVIGMILTFLVGLLGTTVGTWFGASIGETMRTLKG
ncbi:MAG: hypothetical protein JO125_12185 [Chloroflexi bacterium]|nr:hypothetical protein [Ktedonobacteraceae bacterium]MBV9021028.1 hypothetical protein [Ktedonobacteraceae bacterium]MBV9708155.1 hypothetical protein [Chloroflexota bacterium]